MPFTHTHSICRAHYVLYIYRHHLWLWSCMHNHTQTIILHRAYAVQRWTAYYIANFIRRTCLCTSAWKTVRSLARRISSQYRFCSLSSSGAWEWLLSSASSCQISLVNSITPWGPDSDSSRGENAFDCDPYVPTPTHESRPTICRNITCDRNIWGGRARTRKSGGKQRAKETHPVVEATGSYCGFYLTQLIQP